MEDIELTSMWKAYDQKMEEAKILNLQSWVLNIKTFEYLQTHKVNVKLKRLSGFKKRAVILGILWVLLLGVLAYGNHFKNIYFTVSVLLIMLFTIFAIAVYIKHIVLISRINYSESILDAQQKLSQLQTSTITGIRILWLQLPFYTTFFWSTKWIAEGTSFWLIAFPITLLFTYAAVWLYRNINLQNIQRKWLKSLLGDSEWTSLVKAKEDLDEIEAFKVGF